MQLMTASDDPVHANVSKSLFCSTDGRKMHDESDVSVPTVSIGEASQRGDWFATCQAMLPGLSGSITQHVRRTRMRSSWRNIEE